MVAPVATEKGCAYWEAMAKEFGVPLYHTAKAQSIFWERYSHTERWRVWFSSEFEAWAKENLRGEYRALRERVSVDLIPNGHAILANKNKFLMKNNQEPEAMLVIFVMVFENAVDAIHFKMRWQ